MNHLKGASHVCLRLTPNGCFCREDLLKSFFKGPLSNLKQVLAIESNLKMMKNTFYFMWKALLILEILTFLSRRFVYVEKRLDKKSMVNFKIYNLTD